MHSQQNIKTTILLFVTLALFHILYSCLFVCQN